MALYHVSSLKPNEVPPNLQSGTFALKWPEDTNKSTTPIAVTLSVDPKGFYLICLNKITKEIECFDTALIHDTRTGSNVTLPRNASECDQMNIGNKDVSIISKWLTIYYGNTYVPDRDLRIIHFAFQYTAHAQEWTAKLFQYGHNPLVRNLSCLNCLEKLHSRIIYGLVEERGDKKVIRVKNLVQFLCKSKADSNKEAKIQKALEYLELPDQIDKTFDPDQFSFNKFVRFYMQLMERHEIDRLFDATSEIDIHESILAIVPGGKHRRYLGWEKMKDFIVKQNDARGGAFGMDYYDHKAKELVKKYTQHDEHFIHKGMNDESFLRYLLSFDNLIVDPAKFGLYMDMDKPLAHYFIASSHNTYLTGSQLTGRASAEIYRQVLLTGCRCVELDIVDSENDEPEIKHKNTPVRPVPFIQALIAIRESAFKVSPYPVILSLENHCSPRVQSKMAQYLIDVLGDYLLTQPLKTHPTEESRPLPSPNDLKYKILIKNKKLHHGTIAKLNHPMETKYVHKVDSTTTVTSEQSISICTTSVASTQSNPVGVTYDNIARRQTLDDDIRRDSQTAELDLQSIGDQNRKTSLVDEDESFSDDDDVISPLNEAAEANDMNTNPTESLLTDQITTTLDNQSKPVLTHTKTVSKATKAMSDLVHYVVPVRFSDFTRSEERNRSYEVSSFGEDKGLSLIRDYAKEFVSYNQRQTSRIYPRGSRFDSSNYNPYLFWPVGCQMVALNYQTLDIPMQVNLGLFSFNNGCGYLEKPPSLCQGTGSFDPKGRLGVENVVGYQIDIKIISGQFLCQDREPTHVDVEMYGLYADATKRNEYRLRAKRWNGFQAIYDDSDVEFGEFNIRFSKVILPELAALRFAVSEEDGTFIGQCFIPVVHLRPGYRHIALRNQINIPVQSSSLFVYIRKDVHVDAENKELIDQLVSPKSAPTILKEQQQLKQTKIKLLSEQRSQSFDDLDTIRKYSNDQAKSSTHHSGSPPDNSMGIHYPSTTEIDTAATIMNKKRTQTVPIIDANWYRNQLIASSQFHDEEHLCEVLSLDDIEEIKAFKKKREIADIKIRRLVLEFDKKIQDEEERFQKCLHTQYHGMNTLIQKPISNWSSTQPHTTNTSHTESRTSSLIHQRFISDEVKKAETRLLDVYSSKFHSQNEIEYKSSKEYYGDLEKYVSDYYTKQLQNINNILKHEQAKVKEDVRVQMRTEIKRVTLNETDGEKIANLKEKIRQLNIEAGALAFRKLQEMHELLQKKIRKNHQNALLQLHDKKDSETKNRFTKYSNQLNEVKYRLQRDINGAEYNCVRDDSSSMPFRSTIVTSTSLSAISDHQIPTTVTNFVPTQSSMNQSARRQTINNPSALTGRSGYDEFMSYLNQTTESTRL